jgi:hypothetical protein
VILVSQISSRGCYLTVVMDKPSIKVTEAKEGLDTIDYIRVLLVFNDLDLVWVDLNPICQDNKPKIFSLFDTKLVFLDICL